MFPNWIIFNSLCFLTRIGKDIVKKYCLKTKEIENFLI